MWFSIALVSVTTQVVRLPVAPVETLQVTITGVGAPVVLLPGLFGSAYAFRHVAPLLAEQGYQAVVIEPLGIGGSSRPARADYSFTAQADRVGAVLDSLHLRSVIVVAHSAGGSIALRLAVRRPDLVGGVISLEGGPAESVTSASFRRALRLAPLLKLFGGRGRIVRTMRGNLVAASGDASWVTDATVRGYTAGATADLDATLDAYRGMAAAREPQRLDGNLARIRCPVRMLVGGAPHHSGVPAAELARLAAGLAVYALDSIPGAGHFIHEERPERVVDAVLRLGSTLGQATAVRGDRR